MLLNRRQFLILSTALAGGCTTPEGNGPVTPGGERSVDIGSAGQYLRDGVYGNYRNQGFFLVRRGPTVFAVSAICTHRKCKLEAERDKTFYCPCHGSTFDADGHVTEGPAKRDLPVYEVSPGENGNLLVRIRAG